MTVKEFKNQCRTQLAGKSLNGLFALMRGFASEHKLESRLAETGRLEQRYFYMLSFLIGRKGSRIDDDDFTDIRSRAVALVNSMAREAEAQTSSKIYFSLLRYFSMRPEENLGTLTVDYLTELQDLRLDSEALLDTRRRESLERISRDIFNRIWVGHPFSESDAETLSDMLTDTGLPATDREMWLGAVTLGLLAAFDRRRVDLLARVYSSDECRMSVAALTGLVLGAFIHGGTGRHSADFSEVFEALSSSKYFYDDLTTTVLELLRACSTGDVSRKISRDIMPGMMAQGRKLMDELGIDAADPFKASANPEWEEKLHKSGIFDKLREFNEMQAGGADVYMNAFAGMRSFPFFHDVANWFRPFHTDHSALSDMVDGDGAMTAEAFASVPFFCDSDKFAMIMALAAAGQRPDSPMFNLGQHYQSISDAAGAIKADRSESGLRQDAVNNYVRNLYRFFMLFRRKNEFVNPFDTERLNPFGIDALRPFFLTPGLADEALTFCIEKELPEAAAVFADAPGFSPDAHTLERVGYAFERAGKTDRAIAFYERAFDINAGDWLMQRLVACHLAKGGPESEARAKELLEILTAAHPDDVGMLRSLAMLTGDSDPSLSLALYEKLAYVDPGKDESMLVRYRLIAGHIDDAAFLLDRMMASHVDADTCLQASALSLARCDFGAAVAGIRRACAVGALTPEQALERIMPLLELMNPAGGDALLTAFADAVRYDDSAAFNSLYNI